MNIGNQKINLFFDFLWKSKNIRKINMWPEKFDVIVSNPPYSGLDIKFLDKCLYLAKDQIVFVHPGVYALPRRDESRVRS